MVTLDADPSGGLKPADGDGLMLFTLYKKGSRKERDDRKRIFLAEK